MLNIRLLSLTSLLLLTSCSHLYGDKGVIKNRENDYLQAKSVPPLQIPPGLSSSSIHAYYPIPERQYPVSAQRVDLTPPELNSTKS